MNKIKKQSIFALSLALAAGFAFGALAPQNAVFADAATAALAMDETLVDTYQAENGVVNAPTVVVDATDETILEGVISGEEKPSNVILRINENQNVITSDGATIASFANVYEELNKKVIPILYVSDEAQADAVISYFSEEQSILDIAVMSDDAELVGKIKEAHTFVRGIVEFDGTETLTEMVVEAQLNQAITVVIPETLATVSNVSYLQGMFKTVWVRTTGTETVQLANVVFSGAYGLVTNDAKAVYDFYKTLPENTYVRTPFVVAHRADVQNCNENSLSGIASAAAGGATHVELDFHVTKDKELVAMHDTTLTKTTNGTGTIANMTLAQIQQYQIDDHETAEPEKIPTLEDCVRAILETDMIFILELKCEGTEIVGIVKEKLQNDTELAPIFDRMVVITFFADQLTEMKKVLPEVPAAYLNDVDHAKFATVLKDMGQYNAGVDTYYPYLTTEFQADLTDRGIIPWSYTHSTYNDVKKAQKQGFIGLTTNEPTSYREEMKTLRAVATPTDFEANVGDYVNVLTTSYNGTEESVDGKIAYLKDNFLSYEAIASVELDGYTYYTQAFTIEKQGMKLALLGAAVGVVVLVIIVAAVAASKGKKKKKNKKKSAKKANKKR